MKDFPASAEPPEDPDMRCPNCGGEVYYWPRGEAHACADARCGWNSLEEAHWTWT